MNELICFIRDFQTLIAGLFAIFAALIAYCGVIRSAKYNTQEQARSVAAAFFAELASIGARLFADVQNLQNTRVRTGSVLPVRSLDIEVYESNPSSVGRLPADEAFMVANVYKLILDLNADYERVKKYPGFSDDYPQHLAGRAEAIKKQIVVILTGLRETAGIPRDKAAAATDQWAKPYKAHAK